MISATESSDKLPIGYNVQLMKICEKCTHAELEIDRVDLCSGNIIANRMGVIKCESEQACRRIVEIYEGASYDSEGIPEQDTNV